MSFFDTLKNAASEFIETVNTQQPDARSTHEKADDVIQNVDTLDESTLLNLGQHLLQTFTRHDSYAGDGEQAAQEAGTSADAVASGSPDAIASLLTFAKNHPQILQSVMGAFAPSHD
jgi:hypothetical protein